MFMIPISSELYKSKLLSVFVLHKPFVTKSLLATMLIRFKLELRS